MHRARFLVTAMFVAAGFVACLASPGAAGAQLFATDWSPTQDGKLPDSVRVINGSATLTTRDGVRYLRAHDTGRNFQWTIVEIGLTQELPPEFTIDFDLIAPLSTSYPVEIRAAMPGDPLAYLGASARTERVVARCGAVQTGVYGGYYTTKTEKQDNLDVTVPHRCRAVVTPNRLEVSFGGVQSLGMDSVNFGRSRRLALVLPAETGQELYVGPFTVSGPPMVVSGGTGTPPNPSTGTGTGGTPEPPPTGTTAEPPAGATAEPPSGGTGTGSGAQPPTPADDERAGPHVTGGGWVTLASNERLNFGFVVDGRRAGAPSGHLQITWRGAGRTNTLRASGYTALATGQTTTFTGSGTLNGQPGHAFTVTILQGSPNRVRVEISPGGGGIGDSGFLPAQGNITVHER